MQTVVDKLMKANVEVDTLAIQLILVKFLRKSDLTEVMKLRRHKEKVPALVEKMNKRISSRNFMDLIEVIERLAGESDIAAPLRSRCMFRSP